MTLIEPTELADWLEHERAILLDVRYLGPAATETGEAEFGAGHLPGARWVDLDAELTAHHDTPAGGRHPLAASADFAAAMRAHGVRNDSTVVVYDGANCLAAARLWWMLADAGLTGVRVLNGGFAAWQQAGLPIETGAAAEVEPGDFEAEPGHLPQVDADELAAQAGTIWDVRTPERFRGESEPIDPVAGHIPGAKNLPAGDNHEADGRYRPASELGERFAEVKPGDVVYCGSGITAAQTLLALDAADIHGVKLYAGSWSDWISDPSRPVAIGD